MLTPIKKGMRNSRGASSKKQNEAIVNALPIDKRERVAPIPVANARTKLRNPEPAFPSSLPNILTHWKVILLCELRQTLGFPRIGISGSPVSGNTLLLGDSTCSTASSARSTRLLRPASTCGVRIIGHGVEANGSLYCCAHCASMSSATEVQD